MSNEGLESQIVDALRRAPGPEPGAELDARILARAHAAVARARPQRSAPRWMSIAAGLIVVLGGGLALRIAQQVERAPSALDAPPLPPAASSSSADEFVAAPRLDAESAQPFKPDTGERKREPEPAVDAIAATDLPRAAPKPIPPAEPADARRAQQAAMADSPAPAVLAAAPAPVQLPAAKTETTSASAFPSTPPASARDNAMLRTEESAASAAIAAAPPPAEPLQKQAESISEQAAPDATGQVQTEGALAKESANLPTATPPARSAAAFVADPQPPTAATAPIVVTGATLAGADKESPEAEASSAAPPPGVSENRSVVETAKDAVDRDHRIELIRQLLRRGDRDRATDAAARLLRDYPDSELPDDLQALLAPPR